MNARVKSRMTAKDLRGAAKMIEADASFAIRANELVQIVIQLE
jgi:hypothetical protein